jgi:phage-related protein
VSELKPVVWVGDSLRTLKSFPATVQDEVGYAIFLAQRGDKHMSAKPLSGLGPGVLEVVSDYRGETFRAVYTVRLAKRVFVLHAFQKKSRRGIATPQPDIELIRRRLRRAIEISEAER